MATEFFCSNCGTVALRSEKSYGERDVPRPDDLMIVDVRQPPLEFGAPVVCMECGADGGFIARGAALADPRPIAAHAA